MPCQPPNSRLPYWLSYQYSLRSRNDRSGGELSALLAVRAASSTEARLMACVFWSSSALTAIGLTNPPTASTASARTARRNDPWDQRACSVCIDVLGMTRSANPTACRSNGDDVRLAGAGE